MRYPVMIEKDEGEYIATISHPNGRFNGACAAETKGEAEAQLRALIEAMIASAIKDGDDIPDPASCDKGNAWVVVPPNLAIKAQIYSAMRDSGTKKADIARELRIRPSQVDRILNPTHNSTLDQLAAAASVLGKHIDVTLR